jgi:hypothetical protein
VKKSTVETLFDATREEWPKLWPLAFLWELIMLVIWRGLINPTLWAIDCAWRWLGRGRVEWEHWSPRLGDEVSTCSGLGIVVWVNLWRDLVITESIKDPDAPLRKDSLRNCCEPVSREEATRR